MKNIHINSTEKRKQGLFLNITIKKYFNDKQYSRQNKNADSMSMT